ncbi:hypothetical protein L2Y96_19025 [Luteibacter aegosomaticola]|uniref:hypothetical protein n=1 Tax=Luteibacter aegosomaticola TaxID=2911538 RepID=UPI001FF78F94|nr:hypothetical protein [Luteibacter aegosomaticola]UPG89465.1 hypothetical protein L2Y96_19025 [Luteibacter aegosomaticola]
MKKGRRSTEPSAEGRSSGATEESSTLLTIPAAKATTFTTPLDGVPDLPGTRLLCLGAMVAIAAFAILMGSLPKAAADRFAPKDAFLIDALVVIAFGLAVGMLVATVRAFLRVGAWFRIDQHGFAYGIGRKAPDAWATAAPTYVAWSSIARQPDLAYDVGVANTSRADALNPSLRFWYRSREGALAQYVMPMQLRDDVFRCLRFRNSHVLRVVLLQQLASRGLRFHPDVFLEAAVDPETWEQRRALRWVPWVGTGVTLGSLFLLIDITWPTARIIACTLAILVLGSAGTIAMMRRDPRLNRVITFTPTAE